MNDPFPVRLRRGDALIGTVVTLNSLETVEILVNAGFDWLFIDLEHAPLDARAAQALLQVSGERCTGLLRLPLNDEIWIKKALDTGAAGILVPQVNSAEEARRAVRLSKYPPVGTRSVGLARAHGYGTHLQAYIERANRETLVIVQAEHIQAVQQIEEIVAVDGVDAVLVGPYDLSASMGKIGQVADPEVQAAVQHVRQVCQTHGMPVGIFAATVETGRACLQQGYTLVAVGVDTLMLANAAAHLLAGLRT